MKSIAIFLILAFLTGFQVTASNEEPPPPITEPNQTVLEQMKEQLGKISSQVTQNINDGLETIKGTATDAMAYATEVGKKFNAQKLANRRIGYILKDCMSYGQTLLNQGREAVNDQYKKVTSSLAEMKKHPTVMTVNEEVVEPIATKVQKLFVWIADQSPNSFYGMLQRKMSF